MKKTIMKLTASISAVAMLSSLSVVSAPAFAAEYEAIQAEEYISAFENAEEKVQKVARYFVENADSLDEAKAMMDIYLDGLALIESRKNDNGGINLASTALDMKSSYYNATKCTSSPHYAVIVGQNAASNATTVLRLSTNSSIVQYDLEQHPYDYENPNLIFTAFSLGSTKDYLQITLIGTLGGVAGAEEEPAAALKFPFTVISPSTSTEATICNAMQFTVVNSTSSNNLDCVFNLYTASLGDIDHNGIIDSADFSYIGDCCVGMIDTTFSYADVGPQVASVVNDFAFDTNQDGVVNLLDGSYLRQWLG